MENETSRLSFEGIITRACLVTHPDRHKVSQRRVNRWNRVLEKIFFQQRDADEWHTLFQPSFILKNEAHLFKEVFGV
jgi:hypothetical protein